MKGYMLHVIVVLCCSLNTVLCQDEECTGVEDTERVGCGVLGTEEEDCVGGFNCCWEEQPEGVATPWCYYRPSAPCLSSPCVNGDCLDDGEGGYECDCYPGYSGDNCDELDESICSSEDRVECTKVIEVCYELGCCYDPSINLCYLWAGGPRGPEGENCVVDQAERVTCGVGEALKMEECLSQGCCWDPVDPESGVTWCFDSAGSSITTEPSTLDPSCIVADDSRGECGFSGITPEQCESEQCCWAPPEETGPFCFFPNGAATTLNPVCVIPDELRTDCGFSGITPEECKSKYCCWAPPEETGPHCFYPDDL